MKREYWIIIIIYIGMQFLLALGSGVFAIVDGILGNNQPIPDLTFLSYWILFCFSLATMIILFILKKEMRGAMNARNDLPIDNPFLWAFAGIFIALIAQSIAASIENMLGIKMGSENTQQIIKIIEAAPAMIIASSILGPILEEIVFRKIIFGSLYKHKRLNFFLSALISSVIFALAHFEPEHLLLYSAMGFTFAFLYVKTKRIWVPMFAHVAMNTIVVLIQSVYKDEIEKMIRDTQNIQSFIYSIIEAFI